MFTPSSSKSEMLRVTSVRPCSRAVAAIMPSGAFRGFPDSCRNPSSTPQWSAIAWVTGRMRPWKERTSSEGILVSRRNPFIRDRRGAPRWKCARWFRAWPMISISPRNQSAGCDSDRLRSDRLRSGRASLDDGAFFSRHALHASRDQLVNRTKMPTSNFPGLWHSEILRILRFFV